VKHQRSKKRLLMGRLKTLPNDDAAWCSRFLCCIIICIIGIEPLFVPMCSNLLYAHSIHTSRRFSMAF
jgi:hypothetical protein